MKTTLLPLILTVAAIAPLSAQTPGKSVVKTHSVSHRVVVVNGETIVDEKKVNGKLVTGRDPKGAPIDKRLSKRLGKRLGKLRHRAGSSVTSTHTHRVVVVNGKVVVDEETRDGKPVK